MHSNLILGEEVVRAPDEPQTTLGHSTFLFLLKNTLQKSVQQKCISANWRILGLRCVDFKSWVFVFKTRSVSLGHVSSQGRLLYVQVDFCYLPIFAYCGHKRCRSVTETEAALTLPQGPWHYSPYSLASFPPKELSPFINLTSLFSSLLLRRHSLSSTDSQTTLSYFLLHFS